MWWCNNCKRELAGFNVTYEEHCALCGNLVTWLDVEYSEEELIAIIQIGSALLEVKENHVSIPMQYMNDFVTDETIEFLSKIKE